MDEFTAGQKKHGLCPGSAVEKRPWLALGVHFSLCMGLGNCLLA